MVIGEHGQQECRDADQRRDGERERVRLSEPEQERQADEHQRDQVV